MSSERLKALVQANPQEAARLLAQLQKHSIIPHSGGQEQVIEATERFLILNAGRRWGKTKIGAKKALSLCRRNGKVIWWIAPTYKVVKRGYAEVVKQIPPGVLLKPAPADTAFDAGRSVSLQFPGGTRMEFYSAERPEGMLGAGVDFAVLDEAAIMNESLWTQIVRPTLADHGGGALMISTPRGQNWFYRMWARGQDPLQKDYKSWTFPSQTNPTIPDSEWAEMQETLPAVVFEQEVMADFVSNAASVFRFTDDSVRHGQAEMLGQHVVMGVDLAKHRDFTVLTASRQSDREPCFHDRFNTVSWPEQRARIHRAVEQLHESGATGVTIVLDSTGIGDVVFDDLESEGLDVVGVKFTNDWKQKSVSLLAADIERGNAFITEEQVNEFSAYTYQITEAGRWKFSAPDGSHDDEVSAKLLEHWGQVHEGVPDVRLLSDGDIPNQAAAGAVDGTAVEIEAPSLIESMNNPDMWSK